MSGLEFLAPIWLEAKLLLGFSENTFLFVILPWLSVTCKPTGPVCPKHELPAHSHCNRPDGVARRLSVSTWNPSSQWAQPGGPLGEGCPGPVCCWAVSLAFPFVCVESSLSAYRSPEHTCCNGYLGLPAYQPWLQNIYV